MNHGSQRIACRSQVLLSTMWDPQDTGLGESAFSAELSLQTEEDSVNTECARPFDKATLEDCAICLCVGAPSEVGVSEAPWVCHVW